MLIKICGMTDPHNTREVVTLAPDYIGFILYEDSPRYVSLSQAEKLSSHIPAGIKKTAVLVNMDPEQALKIAESGIFDIIQLHGNEEKEYCKELSKSISVMKAFHVGTSLPEHVNDFTEACSFFLYDTISSNYGGSGRKFNHDLLNNYSINKSFFLSGGISPQDATLLKSLHNEKMAGIDLNSKFEITPGIKNVKLLEKFINTIRNTARNDK
jgi:phosphoribosylanthranilate isomerase